MLAMTRSLILSASVRDRQALSLSRRASLANRACAQFTSASHRVANTLDLNMDHYRIATLSCLILLLADSCRGDAYHRYHQNHPAGVFRSKTGSGPEYWASEARDAILAREARGVVGARHGAKGARNVVMFLGDGMSVPTLVAARTLMGQRRGDSGEEAQLAFEAFPTVGLAKTYCVDAQTADSACSATAYLCGAKANYGTIGVTSAVPRGDCDAAQERAQCVESIAALALADGRDAGIVTTTRVTHASPAGAYAHTAERDWESDADVSAVCRGEAAQDDIALQLIHSHPGNKFKVILGGGRREFLPEWAVDEEGAAGRRQDDRDLLAEWRNDKVARNVSHLYAWNRDQLLGALDSQPDYLLGLFEASHMRYRLEADPTTEPSLAELTEVAIRSLSRNDRGFFLFVEGGRIDHAHHENLAQLALDETIELSAAVARATELLSEEDSLIVVTSDHAHVMSFSGYTHRGGDVLGPSDQLGADGVPYMTLSYSNGPGYRASDAAGRFDVTQDDYRGVLYPFPAAVPLDSETHGGDDVGVFALGVAHGMFSGLYEQSQLPHLMAYAACIGPGPHICDKTYEEEVH